MTRFCTKQPTIVVYLPPTRHWYFHYQTCLRPLLSISQVDHVHFTVISKDPTIEGTYTLLLTATFTTKPASNRCYPSPQSIPSSTPEFQWSHLQWTRCSSQLVKSSFARSTDKHRLHPLRTIAFPPPLSIGLQSSSKYPVGR